MFNATHVTTSVPVLHDVGTSLQSFLGDKQMLSEAHTETVGSLTLAKQHIPTWLDGKL